jgi:hypothetical protein
MFSSCYILYGLFYIVYYNYFYFKIFWSFTYTKDANQITNMSDTIKNMMDNDAWDALSLGGTLLVRDSVVKGKPNVKRAAALTVAQYAYDKTVKDGLQALFRGFSNEAYYSSLVANTLGLTGFLLAADAIKIIGKDSDPSESEGLIPDVKVKGKMSKKVINALLESMELIVEQQALMYATTAISGWAPPTGPQPAKTS